MIFESDAPRILVALHSFEPGGVERDILRMTPVWRANGIDARIALGRREGILEREASDLPYYQMQQGRFSTARFETLWMIFNLPGIIRKVQPDILYCASNGLSAVAVAMRVILGKRCPAIVLRVSNSIVRTDQPAVQRWLDKRLLGLQSRTYAAIVAMAASLRPEIVYQFGIAPERAVVINNASLTNEIANRYAVTRDTTIRDHVGRRFVAVGRLMPQKNFALLIGAFARIADSDDRLTILGEGKLRAQLLKQAEQLGVADRIDLPGHLFEGWHWLAASDVFVLSSDFEGLPAVIIEALAAGIPIVATDCAASMPALLEGAGKLVPIRHIDALAEAMDTVLDDPVDVAAMRMRAAEFTTEATTGQWVRLFKTIAARSSD